MNKEELEKLMGELKDGVKADVLEALKKLPLRKEIFGEGVTDTEKMQAKEKSAEWLKALANKDFARVKALSEGTAGEGGYLVPTYFASEIVRLAPKYGVVRSNARVFPVTTWKTNLPTMGAVTAYRVGEMTAATPSTPSTGQVAIQIQKLVALIPMANELLKDANVPVVDALAALSAEALAKKEDEWGLLGLAATEGIFQSTTVPVLTLAAGNTEYADITADDLLDALSLLDESAVAGAKWVMSFSVFNAIRKLKDENGRYIVQEPAGGQPATLWNLPIVLSRVMPKTADANQEGTKFIAVGNFDYMILADKQEYTMDISAEATIVDGQTTHNLFQDDMSAIRVIERVDIRLAEADKAFVTVKTAAS